MTPTPAEISPPRVPVEIFKDWLEENPSAVGLQDAPAFNREAAYLRWLEQSGTFERLGECMVLSLVAPEHRGSLPPPMNDIRARHWDWRWVGGESPLKNPAGYARLCAAFCVPAVMCEVGTQLWDYSVMPPLPHRIVFGPPSPALAAAVLREAMKNFAEREGEIDLEGYLWELNAAFEMEPRGLNGTDYDFADIFIRRFHPEAVAFRIKTPAGDWHARRLGGG